MPERKLQRPDPHHAAIAVTPHDTNNISETKAIFVGGAGAMKVVMSDGATVTFTAIPAGTTINIAVTRVFSTDTAATAIVALY
jgi:hypothetical protein